MSRSQPPKVCLQSLLLTIKMPIVILNKVNGDFSVKFDIGEHVLGRGSKLEIESKKVSRKHGLLIIKSDTVILRAIHNNPCVHQKSNSKEVTYITFGNEHQLHNNDNISLSLEFDWFNVRIQNQFESDKTDYAAETTTLENIASTSSSRNKRHLKENEECPGKRSKSSEKDDTIIQNTTTAAQNDTTFPNESMDAESAVPKIKTESEECSFESIVGTSTAIDFFTPALQIKQEPIDRIDKITEVKQEPDAVSMDAEASLSIKQEVKKEINKESQVNKPSTSGTNNWRDRCWYGKACYRKNPQHRTQFRHPGDDDYDSDPSDTRPICCYGRDCYRRNKEHRKRYHHPGQTQLGKRQPTPNKSKHPPYFQPVIPTPLSVHFSIMHESSASSTSSDSSNSDSEMSKRRDV